MADEPANHWLRKYEEAFEVVAQIRTLRDVDAVAVNPSKCEHGKCYLGALGFRYRQVFINITTDTNCSSRFYLN